MLMLFDSCKEMAKRPNSIPVCSILHPTVTPTQCAPSNSPFPTQCPLMSSTLPNYCSGEEQQRSSLVPCYTGWLDSRPRGEELLKHSYGPLSIHLFTLLIFSHFQGTELFLFPCQVKVESIDRQHDCNSQVSREIRLAHMYKPSVIATQSPLFR